ncbi:DUF3488 and transglutaminase-like domain-containing protein [uncultured Arthrobacter sp.]|uniref:DUF3488 and transglutaminase-like domain-containing protein n=1 Tax=uncultured Arthrobacter sp. TaxID=114050 RepID=UPI0026162BFF|nr:DUF3488 and transglutaminase-like domain-containing protein [uncultured Arthrobacter sp.]
MTATLSPPAPPTAPAPPAGNRPADPWHRAVTAAVLLAVLAAATSLNGVLEPWTWLLPLVRTLVPVLLTTSLVRTLRPGGLLTAVAGVLALAGSLVAQFLPAHSALAVIPAAGASAEVGRLLAQAGETVASEVAPVAAEPGILLVLCSVLGMIALVVDVLSTTLRRPAVSGLALIVVMVPAAIVEPAGVGIFSFVVTVLAFLLLLALAQWRENRIAAGGARASSGFVGRSAVIGVVAVVLSVVVPLGIPGFTSGAFPQGARLSVWGTASGLNPAVTLGSDLRNPTGFGRITYATNAQTALYLRAVTLEDFSGRRWEPDQRINDREPGVDAIGTERGTTDSASGPTIYTRITTQSFASPWLLAPYAPEGVIGLTGSWSWDPANLSVLAMDGGSTAEEDYLVRSRSQTPTAEELGAVRPSDDAPVPGVFSELPGDTPEIVRTTTEDVTGGLDRPYEKALAIQDYLRGPSFTYSVEAPVEGGYDGSGMSVMARFLESRSGYCVHYAGTMAVMARAAGIPSRVAVGYTPGTPTGDVEVGPGGLELKEFEVDSRNAHAWPELYFEGAGWVRFEPTPSRGVVPAYAQEAFTPGVRADDSDALDPRGVRGATGATDAATPPADDAPGGRSEAAGTGALTGLLVGSALALPVLLPFLLRTLRTLARRRIASGTDTSARTAAVAAWAETTETAVDLGYPLVPTDTPRVFARRLAGDAALDDRSAASLARLRTAYEQAEYARPAGRAGSGRAAGVAVLEDALPDSAVPQAAVREDGATQGWDDVEVVTGALRRSSSRSARLRARLVPRSLSYLGSLGSPGSPGSLRHGFRVRRRPEGGGGPGHR